MNFAEILKECEQSGGAGSKKAIQASLAKLNANGRRLMNYAMDPYKVFGVKKFDRPTQYAEQDASDLTPFFMMLDDLANRNLTGDSARIAVSNALSNFTEETASYLERVIDKDPRAGFSADTFNKVWPNEKIATFEVMLADKCEDSEEFEQYITFPCLGDVKYDGQRTIAIVKQGFPVEYRARSGKESEHLNGLFDEELTLIRELVGYDFIMDGEAFASDFTETINAKKEGNDAAKKALKLRCFFMMSLTDWIAQKTDIDMETNRAALEEILANVESILHIASANLGDENPLQKVILSESKIVNNYAEMMEWCNYVIDVLKQEGLILKELKAVYCWDRSMAWCKVKRFYPADARILAFYYGRPKSRLENTIGGAIVAGFIEGTDEPFVTAVGSGFRDNPSDDSPMPLRPEIIANLKKFINLTAVMSYQEISRTKSKPIASLRFPTIGDIRDDKIVEIPEALEEAIAEAFAAASKGRRMIAV